MVNDDAGTAGQPSPEAKAVEGLAHLQLAATEMISAARAFLDVAEGLMRDPRTAAAVATAVHTVTEAASGIVRAPARRDPAADGPGPEAERDERVEHIRID